MSPTTNKNNTSRQVRQVVSDVRQAHELTAKILGHLRMAVQYAHLAADHDEIYDSFGFDRSVEQFIFHAKDAGKALGKLRKHRDLVPDDSVEENQSNESPESRVDLPVA